MIRVGPSLSPPGFRTKLNEFHSQVYVNVDPPEPPPKKDLIGTAPGLSQVLVGGVTIFLSETSLSVGQTVSGFYAGFGPWETPFGVLPVAFNSNYSGKVEKLEGENLSANSLPGADLDTFFLRWNKASVKGYYYPTTDSIYFLGPSAESLAKPSSTPGKFVLTGLVGQSCSVLYLKRVEDTSSQQFKLELDLFTGLSVGKESGSFDPIRFGSPYQFDFSKRSQFDIRFVP